MKHPVEQKPSLPSFLRAEPGSEARAGTGTETPPLETLKKEFPDFLQGSELYTKTLEKLEHEDKAAAAVFQADPAEDQEAAFLRLLSEIDELCREKGFLRGVMDSMKAVMVLPGQGQDECRRAAEKVQESFYEQTGKTATAGTASYPGPAAGRSSLIQNAKKAMIHAGFFGPGSLAGFDAVSLNISGDQYYQKGDIQSAVQEFLRALEIDPDNVNVLNSLGVCRGENGELDDALSCFKAAMENDPAEVMPLYNSGYVYLLREDYKTALHYFHKAWEINPEVYETAFQAGRTHLAAEDPQSARPFLEKAAGLNPESAAALRLLGECYYLLDRLEDAESAYKKALKINPEDASSLSTLGFIYEIQGQNPEIALMLCSRAGRMDPENGLFRHRLARIYFSRGHMENSLAEFQKAQEFGYDSSEYINWIRKKLKTSS